MKIFIKKLSFLAMLATSLVFAFSATASAHVVVKPAEVLTASFQTFNVSVPNEKNNPTIGVKLLIPDSVAHVSPTQKPGWQIKTEAGGKGEAAKVKSITWTGGKIDAGLRDDFTFSAQVPDKPTELQWKAYQTYADGTVVSWDKASEGSQGEEGANSGPFSVTKVVSESSEDAATKQADQAAADAKKAANRSLYIGAAGLVVGLIAIFLATRKQ